MHALSTQPIDRNDLQIARIPERDAKGGQGRLSSMVRA